MAGLFGPLPPFAVGSPGGIVANFGGGSSPPEEMEMPVIEATTVLEEEAFVFLWTLKRVSKLGREEVKSPVFTGGSKSNHAWQLRVCARKMVEEAEFFAVHLILTEMGGGDTSQSRRIRARFQMTLLEGGGKSGKQVGGPAMTPVEFRQHSVWGYDKFLLTSDLHSPTRGFIVNDCAQLRCQVWIDGEFKHHLLQPTPSIQSSLEARSAVHKERLVQDLGKMFQDSVGADVKIICGDGAVTLRAHKLILAARSSVFRAMFRTDMTESAQIVVLIPHFQGEVVKGMLEYLYTGDTKAKFDCAPELLQIAEKYDLGELKEDCEREIVAHIAVDNAALLWVIANAANAGKLKSALGDFIKRNKEAVKATETFKREYRTNGDIFLELF